MLNLLEFNNAIISPLPRSLGPRRCVSRPSVRLSVWAVFQRHLRNALRDFLPTLREKKRRKKVHSCVFVNSLEVREASQVTFPSICEHGTSLTHTHVAFFFSNVAAYLLFQSVVLRYFLPSIFCFGSSLQGNRCQLTCNLGSYYNGHRKTCEACHPACATCAGRSKLRAFRFSLILSAHL